MKALKKIMAALALTAVLAGCSADNILSSIQGGKADTVQKVSRPAVESAELQFTHPAAGDTIAVFDTSAGVFKAVLFSTEAPQAVQNFTTLAQQGFYNGLTVTRVEKDFVVEGVPFPFTSREQYERAMRQPLGREWNSSVSFASLNQPEVKTRRGTIIEPIKLPKRKSRF